MVMEAKMQSVYDQPQYSHEELKHGDMIQIGDEYEGSDNKWITVDSEFFGIITAMGMRSYNGDPKVRRVYENF